MAQIFQARGEGIRPKGSANTLTSGLIPLGQSIGAGLTAQFERQQRGQQLIAQLFQQDPEIAAATIRGMGVNGLVTMGLQPKQAQQLFDESAGGFKDDVSGSGEAVSVETPGQLRPRTALEEAQIAQAGGNVALTGARTATEQQRPAAVAAGAGLAGAQAGLVGEQTISEGVDRAGTEARTAQTKQQTRNLAEQELTEQVRRQVLGLEFGSRRVKLESEQRRLAELFTTADGKPLSRMQRARVISAMKKGNPIPAGFVMLTEGEELVKRIADSRGESIGDVQELQRRGAVMELQLADAKLESALLGPQKIQADIRYLDALATAAERGVAGDGGAGSLAENLTKPEVRQRIKAIEEATQSAAGAFVSSESSVNTISFDGGSENINDDQELMALLLRGGPVESAEADLLAWAAAKTGRDVPLKSFKYAWRDKDGNLKTLRGTGLVAKMEVARRFTQTARENSALLGAEFPNFYTVSDRGIARMRPEVLQSLGVEAPGTSTELVDPRMEGLRKFSIGTQAEIDDLQEQLLGLQDVAP